MYIYIKIKTPKIIWLPYSSLADILNVQVQNSVWTATLFLSPFVHMYFLNKVLTSMHRSASVLEVLRDS